MKKLRILEIAFVSLTMTTLFTSCNKDYDKGNKAEIAVLLKDSDETPLKE